MANIMSNDNSAVEHLLAAISESRDNGEFTDLTLSHGTRLFKVHRIIVCPQSKVFYKACTGGFEVGSLSYILTVANINQESFTSIIKVVDVSYVEVKKMNMSYDDEIPEEAEQEMDPSISSLQLHARMFALGDRYDIPGLRDLAVKNYSSRCAVPGVSLELITSIHDVYTRTPASIRQLRDIAGILMRKNLPEMLDDKVVTAAYEELLTKVPDFTRDLLGTYVKAPLIGYCAACCSNQGMVPLQVKCVRCGRGR
ncbi:MAG: hypothetical protein M1840_003793 [Geoglossum simile]|nr:MAG: hypothetical protein M1840_003793 [Geoglossum simile]